MDTNFLFSFDLIVIALCTLIALFLLYRVRDKAHTERLSERIDFVSEKTTVSGQVEDGDIMLGNSLSCMLIQIDVAKKFSAKSPDIAFNALEQAESLAQQSLGHLRLKRRKSEMSNKTSAMSSNEMSKALF